MSTEEFATANDNVTYFSAYEAVIYGSRQPFRDDGRNVSSEAVDRVMNLFKDTFYVDD